MSEYKRKPRKFIDILTRDYDCKIDYDFKAHAYEITYKNKYFRTNADEEGLLKSIKNIKFDPKNELKKLLDTELGFREAYERVIQKVIDLQDLQDLCQEIVDRNYKSYPYRVIEY